MTASWVRWLVRMRRSLTAIGLDMLIAILCALTLAWSLPAQAKDSAPPSAVSQPAEPPAKLRELLDLISDPQLRAWLDQHRGEAVAKGDTASSSSSQSHDDGTGLNEILTRFGIIRTHFAALLIAVPRAPEEIGFGVDNLATEFKHQEPLDMLRLFALLIGLGYGAQWLFRRAVDRFRIHLEAAPLDTVAQRLRAVFLRFAFSFGIVASFAVGSVAAFLALDWPGLFREIVLGYLLAFLAARLAISLCRFLLAPGSKHFKGIERFRIVPMTTIRAQFWYRRILLIIICVAFAWVTVSEFMLLGISEEARALVAYALGFIVLVIAVEAVWRTPLDLAADAVEDPDQRHHRHARATWLSFVLVFLWLLWVAGAMTFFWAVAILVGLPAAIRMTERSANHILRPPGTHEARAGAASVGVVCLERGLRGVMIIAAIAWLVYVWDVDIGDLTSRNTLMTRMLHGALTAAVIVLIADFLWNIAKALIDSRVEEASSPGETSAEADQRRARLRTLLPILRNLVFIVIVVIAVMMGLSSLGVEIGPLIASAGVVGVAVGFGAQTLVRDVISGVFYLLDDAFRIGEYIQSGNYKGVVESFSLRSVKLRHHNGPLYTVPFGVLGAIQNMSRDWVVEKFNVGVTYDTDLEKVRKIVKKLGQELAADPEIGAGILEPLKMQGVQAFGDFAIQIRMKMMTRPGDIQFTARRRALAMIKKAFDANSICFAYPTVQIAGGGAGANGDVNAAVARPGLELVKPAVNG